MDEFSQGLLQSTRAPAQCLNIDYREKTMKQIFVDIERCNQTPHGAFNSGVLRVPIIIRQIETRQGLYSHNARRHSPGPDSLKALEKTRLRTSRQLDDPESAGIGQGKKSNPPSPDMVGQA